MTQDADPDRWARLRFAIIGPLLAAPPPRGELGKALEGLSRKPWRHPVSGVPIRYSAATLERWYYVARRSHDPITALRRRRRDDAGRPRQLVSAVIRVLHDQYRQWPGWTMQLHYDNLVARSDEDASLGAIPSYATVRRHMKARGLHRKRPPKRNTAWCATGRTAPAKPRGAQLRGGLCAGPMAPGLPSRLTQGADTRRAMGTPAVAGHSR